MSSARFYGAFGALSGMLAVSAGAFGAHALRRELSAEALQLFETGARYQLIHAVALVAVALAHRRTVARALWVSGTMFCAGQLIFPGSLYLLALSEVRAWGALTPLGGVCYLGGWLALGLALLDPEPKGRLPGA